MLCSQNSGRTIAGEAPWRLLNAVLKIHLEIQKSISEKNWAAPASLREQLLTDGAKEARPCDAK